MAAPAVAPVNLTSDLLQGLTSKLTTKQPEVSIKPVADDASEASDEYVSSTVVYTHTPVRSHLHGETVHLRSELQTHLRSVMKTGDDMLSKIRDIVEQLDIAVHAKNLAIEQYEEACKKREEIRRRFESINEECAELRVRLFGMSKARDSAEISLEAASGRLLELEKKYCELEKEKNRLFDVISETEARFMEVRHRLADAEAKVRKYVQEVSDFKLDIEILKKEKKVLHDERESFKADLATVRAKNKELHLEIEKVKQSLSTATTNLSVITVELNTIKIDLKKATELKEAAFAERDLAIEDRNTAIKKAECAVLERDDARQARDQAINAEQSLKVKWVRDAALLEECQVSLTHLRKKIQNLTREHDAAVTGARSMEHLRDEALEMFREADSERHRLSCALSSAVEDRMKAKQEVDEAQAETKKVQSSLEVVFKEKEIIKVELSQSEAKKNEAIAKEVKALEDLVKADKERDEANEQCEVNKDKLSRSESQRELLAGKLETANASEKAAQASEKAALFAQALAEEKLNDSKQREADTEAKRKDLADQLKTAEDENEDLTNANKALKKDNADVAKKLSDREADLAKYTAPVKEKDGLRIEEIFWGSLRITDARIYSKVLQCVLDNKTNSLQPTNELFGNDPNVGKVKQMVVFFSVKKNGEWTSGLPVLTTEKGTLNTSKFVV